MLGSKNNVDSPGSIEVDDAVLDFQIVRLYLYI